MSSEPGRHESRELLAELALGIATGDERARALEHLAGCRRCRRSLEELSDVADELLAMAPAREPPVGFETKVMERLGGASPRPRSRRRWAVLAAAAVILALGPAGAVYQSTRADRDLATRYRDTLAVANGEYFAAVPLYDRSHDEVGHLFGYQGSPSWMFVVLRDAGTSGRLEISAGTHAGRPLALGSMWVEGGRGSWGTAVPVDFHDLVWVRLRSARAGGSLEADL
jgi:Putative zinc-finger